ncbi:hypothetical protein [Streptomyces sp. NPDC058401]|uniref:hypothetical protein n=1 Tax=Streptomyces sp. NPDC058401 TaxID=3346480 RepID=UPI0036481743
MNERDALNQGRGETQARVPRTALSLASLSRILVVLHGVYQPQADTRLLADALAVETGLLEIGTGTGALALHVAKADAIGRGVEESICC